MVTSSPAAHRHLRRRLDPLVASAAATPDADRYRKSFSALAHIWVLLQHVLSGSVSLSVTYAKLELNQRWWQRWGMQTAISFSQLARSSTSRPSTCFEQLFHDVARLVRHQPGSDLDRQRLQQMVALDSTFVRLSAKLSAWSIHGGFQPGVRIQTMLTLAEQLPEHIRMTLADINDHTALQELDLTPWKGWTVLVDRGYYGHRQLARLQDAGVQFIARMSDQARVVILASHPVPETILHTGDQVLTDSIIQLGSPNNRQGMVLTGLRMITYRRRSGVEMRLVTDRHDLPAAEIVVLYCQRWQIELFFRWIKQQLGLIRPIGKSAAAVWITILLVLIVAMISLLLAPFRPNGKSRIAFLHQIAFALYLDAIADD